MRYLNIVLCIVFLASCGSLETPGDEDNVIHVGDVSADDMVTAVVATRAGVAAGTVPWLKEGLKDGMDITYLSKTAQQKARLILEDDVYSLNAYDNEGNLTAIPAKWLDNGAHTFQGVYVPEGLKTQNASQDYTDLIHYTAVPPSAKISATVGRITIPMQHRLARVLAYVLIDKGMSTTLKGYDAANYDAEATKLRFCNVKTLDYVSADGVPVWKTERKVIPHYLGEAGSIVNDEEAYETFRTYKNKSTGKLIFPADADWPAAHKVYETDGKKESSGYICTDYGKVPCYDIIVRPTYSEGKYAMYDESVVTSEGSNAIDFELTLDNDLEYEKQFSFDLNANDETVVFLRVSPERIDYNSTGSRLWKEGSYNDAYYGVNNQNGNTLSRAGGSWQRAYTNSSLSTGVTDGHPYNADGEDGEAQYVDDDGFIGLLKEAYSGGKHHGDYFILKNDITINVSDFPEDFIFTGHLDALDHTIALTGVTDERDWLFAGLDGTYRTAQEDDTNAAWEANVHKENGIWVPASGWRAETVNVKVSGGVLFKDGASITGYVHNCWTGANRITDVTPSIPEY